MATRWYHSLYCRIALGVVAFLAAMLVVQGVLFVWAVSYSGRTLPGQSPARLGLTVALDLSSQIARDPGIDLQKYVRNQYAPYTHPFFVMMADGRVITSGSRSFPEPSLRMARVWLQRRSDRADAERPAGPLQDLPRARANWWELPVRTDRLEPGASPIRIARPSPIVVNGRLVGVVVVPPRVPFSYLLSRFAPMLALVAGGVLIIGTVLTSFLIFGPARRRLRALETAARRLGAGDRAARAPEKGGDEIAAVASAFNAMADDLSARADALADSDRVRRQLLADVSHELTTPVTAMRGYLETLTMPELSLDDGTRARYLSIIGDETARLERLLGDLLDLARLEDSGSALNFEPVTVAGLFARVAARHEPALQRAGVALATSIEAGAEMVLGDQNRLEQAIQNLAANAIRYAPRDTTVRLASRLAAAADGSPAEVAITVEDEGPGIAPAHLPHVFDRFYKADAARTAADAVDGPGGSGLGLSIVKAIVERHGGRLSVTSRPGRTVFEMQLPRT